MWKVNKMYQGIIIEVKPAYSIVLSEGIYYRIRNKKAMVPGMEVLFTEEDREVNSSTKPSKVSMYRYASLAAAIVLILMMGLMYYNNNLAVFSVVTMDINPSVEVSLNKNNKVISLEALNDDGDYLLDVDVEGLLIDDAIALLVEEAKIDGFIIDDQDAFIVITTVALKDDASVRSDEIEALLAAEIRDNDLLREITVAVIEATEEELKQAKASKQPLPLVAMKNKDKVKDAETIKEVFEDPSMMEEMAEESNVYSKYGNSFSNRNDLNVLLDKLGEEVGDALITEYVGEDGSLDDLDPELLKDFKNRAKILLDGEESSDDSEDEDNVDGALRAIIDQLKLVVVPEDHKYEGEPQKEIDDYIKLALEALDGKKDDDKALQEEGLNLLKELQKAGIKPPGDEVEDSGNQDEIDHGGKPDKEVPEEKSNNGKNNDKDNNGKKPNDVEESVTEDVTENDEGVEEVDENKEEKTKVVKDKVVKDKVIKDKVKDK